ncbi:TlpA family protein disulfide reductase [Pirellulimonas nuda]|uniref:TlpA family protein disulfide reductase n=1 Tax=Pirellulimonas nuda TaxID=2528009 RepID=UPI0011AA22A7|nr:TlpA disulfide reductase family protein [Pirellulimonas nuda]
MLFALACAAPLCAGPTSEGPAPVGRLLLGSGDYLEGTWRDSPAGGAVRWESPLAAGAYEFPWPAVESLTFPSPESGAEPTGALRFELVGGDLLYGDLLDVSPESFTVQSAAAPDAPLKIRRESVCRITPRQAGSNVIYSGPGHPSQWKSPAIDDWRLMHGALATDASGASIGQDVGLSDPVRIELELAWQETPSFVLELGDSPTARAIAEQQRDQRLKGIINRAQQEEVDSESVAFALETVGDRLVVMRDLQDAADLAVVGPVQPGPGRLNCVVYLDLAKGRFIAVTPSEEPMAELTVAGQIDATRHGGIRLTNRGGDIRLERLRVSAWDGKPPTPLRGEGPRVVRVGAEPAAAELVGYDAATKTLRFTEIAGGSDEEKDKVKSGDENDEEPTAPPAGDPFTVTLDQLAVVVLRPDASSPRPPVSVDLHSGERLGGAPGQVARGRLKLACPWSETPVQTPIEAIRSVHTLEQPPYEPRGLTGPSVGLETDASNTKGELTGGPASRGKSCLVWRPRDSQNALPLRSSVRGTLVLREPRPKVSRVQSQPPRAARRKVQGFFGAIAGVFGVAPAVGPAADAEPAAPRDEPRPAAPTLPPHIVYLRGGDKLPCTVESIDQQGVHLRSPYAETDFVPHTHVKAIELVTRGVDGRITDDRRQELLTLPRMQEGNAPTHLLVSTKGDYLRCRLLGLSDEAATVEVRLEEVQLERSRIARAIWLDPPPKNDAPADPDAAPPKPAAPPGDSLRVQLLRTDGVRLSFVLEAFESTVDEPVGPLVGVSDVLGKCRALLSEVDAIRLGADPEQSPAPRSYHEWVMIPAKQPREDPDAPDDGASGGSPLVGQPAPPVTLPWLDDALAGGEPFAPDRFHGQVLVLDFWASWCGPCMQAMPVVDRVCAEYEAQGVQLVAVNLQEEADEIGAALERLGLRPRVALDRDGVAAQRYRVTGIPQTVIINRAGDVTHVLVGGGGALEQRLRDALDEALDDALAEPTGPPAAP